MALPRKFPRPDSLKANSTQLKKVLRTVGVAFVAIAITSFFVLMSSGTGSSGSNEGDEDPGGEVGRGSVSRYGETSEPLKVYMYPVRRDLNWALLHVSEWETGRERGWEGGREET